MSFSFVVVGDASLTLECLRLLDSGGHTVAAVVSDDPANVAWAYDRAIPVCAPGTTELPECDYLFSIVNLRMLAGEILARPRLAAINFHDGPLPRYAGLNAPVWALLDGAAEFGVTWHLMTTDADRGDILEQEFFELDAAETALSLNTRCFEAGLVSFKRLLARIEAQELAGRPQDFSRRTYFGAKRRPRSAGVIDASCSAVEAERLVRALDFGPYADPLGTAKIGTNVAAVGVGRATVRPGFADVAGTILAVDAQEISVQLEGGAVAFSDFTDLDGAPLSAADASAALSVRVGDRLGVNDAGGEALSVLAASSAKHESLWVHDLEVAEPLELPLLRPTASGARAQFKGPVLQEPNQAVSSFAEFVARLVGRPCVLDIATGQRVEACGKAGAVFTPFVPVAVPLEAERASLAAACSATESKPPAPRDLRARSPQLRGTRSSGDRIAVSTANRVLDSEHDLVLQIDLNSGNTTWHFDTARFDIEDLRRLADSHAHYHHSVRDVTDDSFSPELVAPAQRLRFAAWNDTCAAYDSSGSVGQAFESAVERHPAKTALVAGSREVSYAELNNSANLMAERLIALGVGPDSLVAVHLDRSLELVVALLAIHKAGGAYVPVDPSYPAARKELMVEDSGARVVVASHDQRLPARGIQELLVDNITDEPANCPNPSARARGENLAYVIYTSGSTGRPKGVMVEHRNVLNFFEGMDDRVGTDPGVWLAVTSMSFDISVLELLWTLTRGFTVVLQGAVEPVVAEGPALSLYFFASETGEGGKPYDLLLEASRIADSAGFEAIWVPERHFHAFGGAFPNPAVAAAAVASVTERIAIRAGSCVLPLHSPLRVAEEWAMVDHFSGGRVGISFASGWQPKDFVLNPEAFTGGKVRLERDIATVQALWRGEAIELTGPDGAEHAVSTLPRPVQRELPTWLTSAGDPETFRMAGRLGANILTHLLGQPMAELTEKLRIYREAWNEAGHPGQGRVTLMLHTFVSEDDDEAKETVREPMIQYLGSSVGLIKNFASSFPAFKRLPEGQSADSLLASLTDTEMRELLEVAFERYYETSGLFGTPERVSSILESSRAAGVDEVACLIDFGVPTEKVLESIRRLSELRPARVATEEASIGELIVQNGISHLQCTPSMAGMLVGEAETREALAQLRVMLVGGEAFPSDLAATLRAALTGKLVNMYGPTETTVWSTTSDIGTAGGPVSIGTPIANTSIYIVGPGGNLVPEGCTGELWIGGAGVTRGYHGRSELTAERFVTADFAPGERLYRTGDLARWAPDGTIDFLGRLDQQVKVRGYRIEPGEIESVVRACAGVSDAVVIAREDEPGDQRLVCYYVATEASVNERALRDETAAKLPPQMVPTNFIELLALPLTPNKKVDRKALPAPAAVLRTATRAESGPAHDVRPASTTGPTSPEVLEFVSDTWIQVLKAPTVERDRTFFDCGGNSLLLLQVHRRLLEHRPGLRLTDLFKYPTINALAAHLSNNVGSTQALDHASARAQARRTASGRRAVEV